MKDNEAACACCGKVDNKHFMKRYGTGKSVQWYCTGCYRFGALDVQKRMMGRCQREKKKHQ